MKNFTKRIIALFAVLCVASASMAGCGKKKSDESESSAVDAPKQYALQFGKADDGSISLDDPNKPINEADPIAPEQPDDLKTTTEAEVEEIAEDVTDAAGEPVTEVVEATEADGEPATAEGGAVVTNVVKVTQIVTKPAPTKAADSVPTTAAYKAKEEGRYAMWLDISENENFFFEDEMLKATFKVKEGIPDGDYKITISPDLSDVAGVAVKSSKVFDGIIRVNNGSIESIDLKDDSDPLIFYGDNIACKQGDTIDWNINIKNNTGLVAFCIWFYYDANALEFIDAEATGAYAEIAKKTDIGAYQYGNEN